MIVTTAGGGKSAKQLAEEIRVMTGWIYQRLGAMQDMSPDNAEIVADIMEQIAPIVENSGK